VRLCFPREGTASGEASVIVPIAQMGFVVTALLGFFLLREPSRCAKRGVGAAIVALACLAH